MRESQGYTIIDLTKPLDVSFVPFSKGSISGNGEIFIFPLRLVGVSGSPCRVIVRIPKQTDWTLTEGR